MPRHIRDFSAFRGAKFESQLGKYTEKNKRNRPKLISYIINSAIKPILTVVKDRKLLVMVFRDNAVLANQTPIHMKGFA